ncbi:16S rRNA (guanine(966)-N(2))-methyltransferase RsmD [Nodosilinea sp. LEGE 07088]|uniref:16S rRNA (guanine(966)-N(2))-methyltransferase RsmD n=1 Tax=Nodosilinea sp. LEGE 07088 TaxID=2777968 RepID=UPI001881B886|nr:16S rRNA (guanine(966)-N(2))-methyltransferase RsmD [Nodosilinea sp. LEGE 07088]MBE9140682.1 16S rRNA (guanine(966)-N(2))-methyltransferase RsmD [Nodosilinea sp. LEGE 07088]
MLRIYGNRALKTLPGDATRPTSARVREALFNIWQGRVVDCRWLDLCTGSGAMGAEALCRGAAEVVGIELSAEAYAVTRENWQKVAQSDQTISLFRGDVVKQLSRLHGQPFDCIYFDPPYTSELYAPVLERVVSLNLLQPTGEIAVEHSPAAWEPAAIAGLELVRQKQYGTSHLAFYAATPGS